MAFANANVSDIIATTLEHRSNRISDQVSKSNALLNRLRQKGKIRKISGGREIVEQVAFAENPNFGWYSGYDQLPLSPADVISAAVFPWKQAAVPVVISGLELLQNSGPEAQIDLLEQRVGVAESTMENGINTALLGDGTGSGGRVLTGLDAMIPQDPTTGTYGGINRATWSFWRPKLRDTATTVTATNVFAEMTALWLECTRGSDRPDLILAGSTIWSALMSSAQTLVRFTDTDTARIGFPSIKFMDADVVAETGMVATDAYFLNTKYLSFVVHAKRNMVPLAPTRRWSVNQDAEAQILAFAGNLTSSGAAMQGRLKGD